MLNVITLTESLLAVGLMSTQGLFKPLQGRLVVEAVLALGASWKCFRGFLGAGESGMGAIPLSSSTELFHFDLL